MVNILIAMCQWMQNSSTGFGTFLGFYDEDDEYGSQGQGPFLDVAPEDTQFPYVVYNILDTGMDQGFFTSNTIVVEKPWIRFHLFDVDSVNLSQNLDYFVSKLDNLTGLSYAGESCRKLIRIENPVILDSIEFSENGQRVFHAIVSYQIRNQRAL